MITPTQVTKTAAHDSEHAKSGAIDPVLWSQAVATAAKPAPQDPALPIALHIKIPAPKPAATPTATPAATASAMPLDIVPIPKPAAKPEAVPATTTASPAKKTEAAPTFVPTGALFIPPPAPPPTTASAKPTVTGPASPEATTVAATITLTPPPISTAAAPPAIAPAATPAPLTEPEKPLPTQAHAPSSATAPPAAAAPNSTPAATIPPPVITTATAIAPPVIEKTHVHDSNNLAIAPPGPTATVTNNAQAPAPTTPSAAPPIAPTGANLAAAVTALQQSGQSSATLRLDPPGLGNVTIHLGLGQNDAVNVLFVAAVPQTAQIIANHLNDLRQAMDNSGLSLGNTQVGSGNTGGSNNNAPQYQPPSPPQPAPITAEATPTGIRAYA